jgi:hypothetical protein
MWCPFAKVNYRRKNCLSSMYIEWKPGIYKVLFFDIDPKPIIQWHIYMVTGFIPKPILYIIVIKWVKSGYEWWRSLIVFLENLNVCIRNLMARNNIMQ